MVEKNSEHFYELLNLSLPQGFFGLIKMCYIFL